MRLRLAIVATAFAIATPLVAQQMKMEMPGKPNPAAITGGTYTVDAGHTLVGWRVDHMGFTPYFGIFGNATGTLTLDRASPTTAKVDISIPVAQVTTAHAGLTKHLLSKDFFGAAPAPARFVSSAVTVDGQNARITGDLTLNGITKPVTLDAKFYGAGKAQPELGGKEYVGFTAKTTIKRSDFKVSYGIPIVSDEVELDISAAFEK